jgi:hypothetical protein
MTKHSLPTVAVLAFLSLALMGCDQAITTGGSSYAGTGTYLYLVHATEILAEATVTTDSNGVVTDANWNEYHGPSNWVYGTGTSGALAAGDMIRLKVPGKNTGSTILDTNGNKAVEGYTFFYYSSTTMGWVEYTPTYSASWVTPSTGTTDNYELKMTSPIYAQAYVDACKAVTADPTNMDLTTVTFAINGTTLEATLNANNASAQANLKSIKTLNKNATASAYFPVTASNLGFKANHDRIIEFFKTNPTADYAAAATATVTWTAYPAFTAPSATYTATTDAVWTLGSGTDAVSGATCSDFPSYALGLQSAYLYALADRKGGNTRSAQ